MNAKSFVDTNVLVYVHDLDAVEKCSKAQQLTRELWESGNGVISTQVLQELYITLRRKLRVPMSITEAEETLRDYFRWQVVINNRESILRAISLEARYQISFWDGLLLQAAQLAGTEILYSEDLNHGQRYGTVRVINPFVI